MFLGVDIGTTAVKALVADEEGRAMARASAEVPLHSPGPDRQEQDFEEAWAAVAKAVKEAAAQADASAIEAISFSAAMHGFMPVSADGKPLSRQWSWADGRAAREAAALADEPGAKGIYQRTGSPLRALYYPARLRWLRDHDPETFKRAARFSSIKELILERLTGERVMDRAMASSMGILDLARMEFDEATLAMAGTGVDRLPALVSPSAVIGRLRPEAAAELGLPKSLAVVPGGGDGGLANLGSGAVEPGQAAVTIGTSGAMRVVSDHPIIDPDERTWCYLLDDGVYYAGGAINSGGIVYRWVRDSLYPDVKNAAREHSLDPYEIINQEAESVPPGSGGILFLPYLMGERTPLWDPEARGVIIGLGREHTRAHIARAAMEGSALAMCAVHRALQESGAKIDEVRASGGFMRSALWLRILCDALGEPIAAPAHEEGSALGAIFLAMKAVGRIKDLREARALVPIKVTFHPSPEAHAVYERLYEVFAALYPRVREFYAPLREIATKKEER